MLICIPLNGIKIQARNYSCENHEEVMHENPHAVIDPEGLQHGGWECLRPAVLAEEWIKTHPDCIQTGMYATGALILTDAQLSGLERRQNSVMGSSKTVRTVRDEDDKRSKSENPTSFSCGSMSDQAFPISSSFLSLRSSALILPSSYRFMSANRIIWESSG